MLFNAADRADCRSMLRRWGLQGHSLLVANQQQQERAYLGKKGPSVRGVGGRVASTARRYCLVVQNKGNASDGTSASDV